MKLFPLTPVAKVNLGKATTQNFPCTRARRDYRNRDVSQIYLGR